MTNDAAFATFTDEITAAKEALLSLVKQDPGRSWQAYELKTRARDGWSAGAVSLALNQLIDDGTLQVEEDRVRLPG